MGFRLGKIQITISFFFPAILCYFALCDDLGILQTVLMAVLLHELSHLLVLYALGYPVEKMHFSATGIAIQNNFHFTSLKHELLVHLSGPFMNLLLAATAFGLVRTPLSATVNLVMGCFNLLPIGNLDGGNALRAFLIHKGLSSPQTIQKGNHLFLLLLLGAGVVLFLQDMQNFTLLLIAVTMLRTVEI